MTEYLSDCMAGCCPNCGSDAIDYNKEPRDHEEGVAYIGHCKDCGAKFEEVYQLEHIGNRLLSVPKKHKEKNNEH